MPSNIHYTRIEDLPASLPLFVLPGALLLPRGQMPLNIFEPRYLAMTDAALAGHRMIGMIQPDPTGAQDMGQPALYPVGCAGRITQFAETGDGRYLLQLSGVARFRLAGELPMTRLFREAKVDFAPFAGDLDPRRGEEHVDREAVLTALRAFCTANQVEIDWNSVAEAANEALVNALSMMAPYGVAEKQALLEAGDLRARAEMLVALTEIELARDGSAGSGMQ